MERYSRHIALNEVGREGQLKLNTASVLVVGAGGLGCPALQYLTAAGIGHIGIIDHDLVELSNLQRQILFGTDSIGMNKALAAKKSLSNLNPEVEISAFPEKLTAINALNIFQAYDIILDGTDNFEARYIINDAAVLSGKPVVYGAIFKFQGQVAVFNYEEGPTYRCLFPDPPTENSIPNCAQTGVLGVLPGIIGCMQANEAIKMVLGIGTVLSGKVFCLDTRTMDSSSFVLNKSEAAVNTVLEKGMGKPSDYQMNPCVISVPELTWVEAFELDNCKFIDVREREELPRLDQHEVIEIPLDDLKSQLENLDTDRNYVLVCQTGQRSARAVTLMLENGFQKVFNLKGGIEASSNKKTLKYET